MQISAKPSEQASTPASNLARHGELACGLLQADPKVFLQAGAVLDETAILDRIAQRAAAKAERDFALADTIRKNLLAQGIVLKDSASGTTWEVVK